MASTKPTLVCKACDYVNESERVYCHNCGVKLDRELLANQQPTQFDAQKRQREIKKMMNPGRGHFAKASKAFLKTVILAAIAGALIDAALPPEGIVQNTKKDEAMELPQIDLLLENLTVAPAGKRVGVREEDINTYIKRERFKKLPSWFTDSIPLYAFVQCDEGTGRLVLQADIVS